MIGLLNLTVISANILQALVSKKDFVNSDGARDPDSSFCRCASTFLDLTLLDHFIAEKRLIDAATSRLGRRTVGSDDQVLSAVSNCVASSIWQR